jgi:hypothetical protein
MARSVRAADGILRRVERHRSVRRIVLGESVARVARCAVLSVDRGGDLEQVVGDWLRDQVVAFVPCRPSGSLGPLAADCPAATASRADFSIGGKAFPLRSARLKIPLQALGESEYFSGSGPVSSTSLNEATNDEDPAAALRDGSGPSPHSHVLSVQHSVREPIPELAQRPEEGAKVPSSVG